MLYIATPYSHSDPVVMQQRYKKSCIATAKLMAAGIVVFNPLANTVPVVELGGLDLSHEQFMQLDIPILQRSDEILVVALDGWTESKGVKQEMFEAFSLRKPITLIDEVDIERLPAVPKHARRFLTSSILTEVYDNAD